MQSAYDIANKRAQMLRSMLDKCADNLTQEEIDCVEDTIKHYRRVCDNIINKVLTRMSKEGVFNA